MLKRPSYICKSGLTDKEMILQGWVKSWIYSGSVSCAEAKYGLIF